MTQICHFRSRLVGLSFKLAALMHWKTSLSLSKNKKCWFSYLDDLIVFAADINGHLDGTFSSYVGVSTYIALISVRT